MNLRQRLNIVYRAWRYRLKVERPEIAYLLRHLAAGQTAVDIGAHKGAYTYWMQKAVGPQGRVFAFEPQPELAAYLRLVSAASRHKNLTVTEAALSANPGSLQLFRPTSTPSPGASLERFKCDEQGESIAVRVESLDHFFGSVPGRPIHFIKCDVEGHERDVFRGAEQILRTDRPILLFECESRHHADLSIHEVFDFLHGLGYAGTFFRRGIETPLAELTTPDQAEPHSPGYVYNFAFKPATAAGAKRKSA